MNRKTWLSRRNVLRGAGVGLALPWLESLCPAPVQAQAQAAAKTKQAGENVKDTAKDAFDK